MPTYVYRFIDSGETIEVRQAFEDDALTEAPHPSDGVLRPVKKVFTPVGVTFKGSGFYKTDSGGAKKSPAASPTMVEAVKTFPRQALHARFLALAHPITGEVMKWESPLPDDFVWLLSLLNQDRESFIG